MMKPLITKTSLKSFSFLIMGLCFLIACTGYSDKKQAIQKAEAEVEKSYFLEIDLQLTGKQNLKKAFADSLLSKTKIEVREIKDFGQRKIAILKIKKVPKAVRDPLIDIISKIDETKESSFNASNAIQLIYQQLGLPTDKYDESQIEIPLTH
jgi:hypothetical protein